MRPATERSRESPTSAAPARRVTSWRPWSGSSSFFGLWELVVRVFDIPAFELPPPSRILQAIADDPGFYARNAWVTGREALARLRPRPAAGPASPAR